MKVTIEGTPQEVAAVFDRTSEGPRSVSIGVKPDGSLLVNFDSMADKATQVRDLQRASREFKARYGREVWQ